MINSVCSQELKKTTMELDMLNVVSICKFWQIANYGEIYLQALRGFTTYVIGCLSQVFDGFYGFMLHMNIVIHKRLSRNCASRLCPMPCNHFNSVYSMFLTVGGSRGSCCQ